MIDIQHQRFVRALTLLSSVSMSACQLEEKSMEPSDSTSPVCLTEETFQKHYMKASLNQDTSTRELQNSLKAIHQKMEGVADTVENIRYQVEVNQVSAEHIEPVWTAIQEQVGQVVSEVSILNKSITAIQKSNTDSIKNDLNKLPFELSDLGQWGNELFVSVRHQGEFVFISTGEVLEGWQLVQANSESRKVTWKHLASERTLNRIVK